MIVAWLCTQYLGAAKDKEDLQRRLRVVSLERRLLIYAYGSTGYWKTLEEIKKS